MTLERWSTFSKRYQLLFIGTEFERAKEWQKEKTSTQFQGALERALALIDLSLNDPKWSEERYRLWVLRDAVAEYFAGKDAADVGTLYAVL